MNNRWIIPITKIYSLAAMLEGIVAIVILVQEPSEVSFFLGFSKTRLIVAVGLILWIGICSTFTIKVWRDPKWQKFITERIFLILQQNILYVFLLAISLFGLIISSQLWHLAQAANDPYVLGYLGRLIPLLLLMGMFGFQNLVLLPLMRYGWSDLRERISGKLMRTSGLLFVVILLLWALIALTRLGLTPDQIGWDPPGVPVLAVQVWLASLIGLLFLGLDHFVNASKLSRFLLPDVIVSLLIWGAAAFFWSQQPMAPDYFVLTPQEPNFELYPYSDAATHDVLAQRLLIGEGFPGVARKPLYVIFLALLHSLSGQSYEGVALLQVMVIALIPVFIYWLTKSLHHRVSGIIAAVLIILREKNAIVLSGQIGVSHAKLLMSDLPAVLGVVLLTWMIVAWLSKPQTRQVYPLGVGGIFGLLLLIRPQIVVLLPAVALLILILSRSPIKFVVGDLSPDTGTEVPTTSKFRDLFFCRPALGLQNLALMALGLGLTLGPWLWRSYQLTGEFVINDPNQNAFLTQQYSLTPGYGRVKRLPSEPDGEYTQRVDEYLTNFIKDNPGVVAGFIASHFSHNLVEMIVALPMSPWVVQNPATDLFPYWSEKGERLWEDCCSVNAYVGAQPFWDQWHGTLSGAMVFSLVVNLAVIAIGLGVAFERRDIIGWIPLGVSLVYVLSTSVGRYSGWRLLLPADWAVFLYFAIGLGQIAFWALAYFTRKFTVDSDDVRRENTWQRISAMQTKGAVPYKSGVVLGILLLGLGLAPILIEQFVSPRYTDIAKGDALAYFESLSDAEQLMPSLESLLEDDRSVVFEGRALYPRFYKAGRGEPGGDWPAFSPRDYPRLGFIVVGPYQHNVVFPLAESPAYFPHASDVIVLGCRADAHISARFVVLVNEDEYTLVHLPEEELSCSLGLP